MIEVENLKFGDEDRMEVNVGKIISSKRKEKGVTQDDLANFIGISKSSVSKWETGLSLPDIAHLPQLASYFNTSIDELMGYEPQMTNEDITKLYNELSKEFTTKSFDEVISRCRIIIKKYFSCFPLLYRMGLLFVNYGWSFGDVSNDGNPNLSIIEEAKELFIRVKEQSSDIELKELALNLEATCEMMLGKPNEVIELLQGVKPPPPHEGLLAQAYIMTGKVEEAKTLFQKMIYYNIHILIRVLPTYLATCADDCLRFEEVFKRTNLLIDAFNLRELDPVGILPFYLAAAQAYVENGKLEKALSMLEAYTGIVKGVTYPLEFLKGDHFFDSLKNLK
jgi:transcriptional regulator with XRE-family HTH domain